MDTVYSHWKHCLFRYVYIKIYRRKLSRQKETEKRVRPTLYVHNSASCAGLFHSLAIFYSRLLFTAPLCRNSHRADVDSLLLDYQTLGRPRSFNSKNYCSASTLVSISRTTFCSYTICYSWHIHCYYYYFGE